MTPRCENCGTTLSEDEQQAYREHCEDCVEERTKSEDEILILDDKALRKRYNRCRFRDLRNLHALDDCREDYLQACWKWLYEREASG